MSSSFDKVRQFHQTFRCPVSDTAHDPGDQLRRLRLHLLMEELTELANASGYEMEITLSELQTRPVDLVECADALGDIEYVTHGAHLVYGFPGPLVLNEIHRANMSKLGGDGQPMHREDGKILKGPNYKPPDIAMVLQRYAHWKPE